MSKSNEPIIGKIKFTYPIFTDQIEPKGRLIIDRACHACWFYVSLAMKNLELVGIGPESQVIVVEDGGPTPLWNKLNFDQIARSIALMYQLDSPEVFLRYRPLIEREALRLGGKINDMVWRPFGVGVLQ